MKKELVPWNYASDPKTQKIIHHEQAISYNIDNKLMQFT